MVSHPFSDVNKNYIFVSHTIPELANRLHSGRLKRPKSFGRTPECVLKVLTKLKTTSLVLCWIRTCTDVLRKNLLIRFRTHIHLDLLYLRKVPR